MSIYQWARAAWGIFLRHPVNILVYQMGKVGSTSVCRSLKEAGFRPLQVHRIVSDLPHMDRFTETDRDFPFHFYVGRLLYPYLKMLTHHVQVITLVRDPIARYVSAQFQVLDHEPIPQDDPDRAVQQLLAIVRKGGREFAFPWFEDEMNLFLEVNPLVEPFDKEAGYAILETSRADVLVLKLERLSELIPGILSSFVGRDLSVVEANRGEESTYADYYQEVLDRFRLSEETCREIYSHEHVTHFYTSEEIEQFIRRWSG